VPTDPTGAVRIRLRIGDDVATATLEDSAPARDFAAGNDFELTIEPLD
jgi:hypothetical protein